MRISTKGRYAVRLMLDLAVYGKEEYVSIKSISQRHNISDKYLEQIINQLSKAKFVKSCRGANGGYKLTRPPEEYTVGMILRLVEGSLSPVPCLDYTENDCPQCESCTTLAVWQQIKEAVEQVVDHITLAQLQQQEEENCKKNQVTERGNTPCSLEIKGVFSNEENL